MNGTAKQAFANRYAAAKVFSKTPLSDLDHFFNSVAQFVGAEVLGRLVSAYAAVRFYAIDDAVSEAHRAAATELGKGGLFRIRRALLDHDTCYGDNVLAYLSDARHPPKSA